MISIPASLMKRQVLRFYGQFLAAVGDQQQGVMGLEQIQAQVLHDVGHAGIHGQGQLHLRLDEVEAHQQALLGLDQRCVFANALGQVP